jgi:hypothetical protein
MTLQMTATLHLEDVVATITHGLVEEFHAAFARLGLLGPGDLCTACPQAADCATRARCLHLQASAGLYTNLRVDYRRVPLGVAKIGRIAVGWGRRIPTTPWPTIASRTNPGSATMAWSRAPSTSSPCDAECGGRRSRARRKPGSDLYRDRRPR